MSDDKDPFWHGIIYLCTFVAVNVTQSFISSYHAHRMQCISARIKTTLIGAIYRKSMLLANSSKKNYTTGEIVNMMAVDAQRFVEFVMFVNYLWSTPFQIIISLWLLWNELGASVIGGLTIMVVLIPVNAYCAYCVKNLLSNQMRLKDERLKTLNEMLNGMKVLKLYAWEQAIINKVERIREQELKYIKKAGLLSTIFVTASTCTPIAVTCTTFTIFILTGTNGILTAEKAFVSIALFNMLRMPLAMIPNIMSKVIEVSRNH